MGIQNPKNIKTVHEKATYSIPKYRVTNEGLEDAGESLVLFCKGNKEDESALRQEGVFTESLLAVCLKYLQENNVGDLANRDTSIAITHIEEALMWLNKRAEDRKLRGVQGTYQK